MDMFIKLDDLIGFCEVDANVCYWTWIMAKSTNIIVLCQTTENRLSRFQVGLTCTYMYSLSNISKWNQVDQTKCKLYFGNVWQLISSSFFASIA